MHSAIEAHLSAMDLPIHPRLLDESCDTLECLLSTFESLLNGVLLVR